MKIQLDYKCPRCPGGPPPSSPHIVADCSIPTFFIDAFNLFASRNPKIAKYKLDPLILEFGFPHPELITSDTNEQLQHIFIAVKLMAFEAQSDPSPRWN